jgi:hypothetical protein
MEFKLEKCLELPSLTVSILFLLNFWNLNLVWHLAEEILKRFFFSKLENIK